MVLALAGLQQLFELWLLPQNCKVYFSENKSSSLSSSYFFSPLISSLWCWLYPKIDYKPVRSMNHNRLRVTSEALLQIHISCWESLSRLINLNCFCGRLETPQQTDKQTNRQNSLLRLSELSSLRLIAIWTLFFTRRSWGENYAKSEIFTYISQNRLLSHWNINRPWLLWMSDQGS